MRRKNGAGLAALGLAVVLLAAAAWLALARGHSGQPVQGTEGGAEFFALYRQCGHKVAAPELGEGLAALSYNELSATLPATEGWRVTRAGGRVEVVREMDGFCPEDAAKRHLGARGEYLAIFRGPAGAGGEMLRLTSLRLADLPEDWRRQLEQGKLEFPGEQELLAALDSLDEYQP